MITKDQALGATVFHWNGCTQDVGPRGKVTRHSVTWRKNGMTKTWARSPDRFSVPIKQGLYNYSHLTEDNAEHFHTAEDCPLEKAIVTEKAVVTQPVMANGANLCPICGKAISLVPGKTLDGRMIGSCGDAFTIKQWRAA